MEIKKTIEYESLTCSKKHEMIFPGGIEAWVGDKKRATYYIYSILSSTSPFLWKT